MIEWLASATGSAAMAIYLLGLSLAGAALLAEAVCRRELYAPRDTAANLTLYAGHVAITVLFSGAVFQLYSWVRGHAVLQLTAGGFHLGQDGLWWEWVALFLAEDLCFYGFHRLSHRSRILWASHVTHHSSRRFNLSVAFRQTWVPFLGVVFWLPLPLLGFDPLMVLTAQLGSLFYQDLLHTQVVPRLGPLEWIFNTPSHHAVHHGSNDAYLDKNYGGVLIIWDWLFGSFAARQEPVRFGLTHDLDSHNPLFIALHEWGAMARGVLRARSWRGAAVEVLAPPGAGS